MKRKRTRGLQIDERGTKKKLINLLGKCETIFFSRYQHTTRFVLTKYLMTNEIKKK